MSNCRRCAGCRHFVDDGAVFERELPGLLALSSGFGDSRGDQGLCRRHELMVLPRMSCPAWRARHGR